MSPKTENFGVTFLETQNFKKENYLIFFFSSSSCYSGLLTVKVLPLIVPCSFFYSFFCPAQRDKFVEIDLKPVCKHCYEKMPEEFKRRLAKREREAKDKDKQKKKKPVCL